MSGHISLFLAHLLIHSPFVVMRRLCVV